MFPPFRARPLLAAGCAAALAVALIGPARADPVPTYEALLRQTLAAPAAAEADALLDAAEARVTQARARPNPEVSLEVENAFGSGPYSGLRGAETTLSVSQELELWGQRGARVGAARADAVAAGFRREARRADLAADLAIAFAEAESAEHRFRLAEEARELATSDARAAQAQVTEGRLPRLRAIQADTEVAAAQARLDEAAAEREAAFARLAAFAGADYPYTVIAASLLDRAVPAAPASPAGETLVVRALAAEVAAAEGRARGARLQGRPGVRAGVGVRRFEEEEATALVGGVSLRVPLFDRNRGNITAAEAEIRAAEARLQTARLEAVAAWRGALARLRSSESRVAATDAAVSAGDEAYRLTRIGFEAGRLSQLELRQARAVLIEARDEAVAARLARVRAEVELARLAGRTPFESISQ